MTDDDFSVELSEDGDDRSGHPFGERYADRAVLLTMDGTIVAEWEKRTEGYFSSFHVIGSDFLDDTMRKEFSGYRDLSDAIAAAKAWVIANTPDDE
jgi:hypothetical protein